MAPLQVEVVDILSLEQHQDQQGNASTSSFPLDNLLHKEAGGNDLTEAESESEEEQEQVIPPRKSVTFRGRIQVRECLHIKNYTPQERKECWYNKSDLSKIKEDIYNTRDMIAAGELECDTEDSTRRGSLNYVEKECTRRSRAKYVAREAVFDEQDAQRWELGLVSEPKYIAHFYRAATHLEVQRAYSVGLRDQMEAEMANMAPSL